jgi:hypothetical protein
MNPPSTPPVRFFIPASFFLIVIGWGGLALLVLNSLPTVAPRWLFFFLLVMALAGTVLPVAAFLNLRFSSLPPASAGVIVRQSTWVGIFGATLAWLQMGRVLSLPMLLLLLIGLGLVEFLIRISERSQYHPPQDTTPQDPAHE